MAPTGEMEFLEQGAAGPSRRRVVLVAAVLLALAALGVVADQRLREREAAQVSRCAEEVHQAADLAQGKVAAIATYVRPTLTNGPSPRLRAVLHDLVSAAAVGAEEPLLEVRSRCSRLSVLWVHRDLRRQKRSCLSELDRLIGSLRATARDGSEAFRSGPPRQPGCEPGRAEGS